jgi:hypothetical protein
MVDGTTIESFIALGLDIKGYMMSRPNAIKHFMSVIYKYS